MLKPIFVTGGMLPPAPPLRAKCSPPHSPPVRGGVVQNRKSQMLPPKAPKFPRTPPRTGGESPNFAGNPGFLDLDSPPVRGGVIRNPEKGAPPRSPPKHSFWGPTPPRTGGESRGGVLPPARSRAGRIPTPNPGLPPGPGGTPHPYLMGPALLWVD